MRIALITDAWSPQVNGVVQTLLQVTQLLKTMGHELLVLEPGSFRTIPCPTYPEIRLALFPRATMKKSLLDFKPQHIHIATEGPLGYVARKICLQQGWSFTTAFHTQFPEYIQKRTGLPLALSYAWMRRFHNSGKGVMVATPTVQRLLESKGFQNIKPWCRGVDTNLFNPQHRSELPYPSPHQLYVGRVAIEKNLKAFLELPSEGTKIVVGDGPALQQLQRDHPQALFLGKKRGEDLAKLYASADVFVFPSRTDTFGLVMLEALASGTPVAAYPVQGPLDVLTNPKAGVMDTDLHRAVQKALELRREDCIQFAHQFSWLKCAELFYSHLVPASIADNGSSQSAQAMGE